MSLPSVDAGTETRVPPPPAPPPRTSRPLLHVGLFLATAVTATAAGAGFGLAPIEVVLSSLDRGLTYAACLLAILGAHEMGHYLACRYYGIRATLPYFIPGVPFVGTFGAVIRIRSPIPSRRALFDVAAAGPIAGFVVALPIFLVGLWQATPTELPPGVMILGRPVLRTLLGPVFHDGYTGSLQVGPLYLAGWVGMLVTALNLFPVGQLDGGHVAYSFSRRLHRRMAFSTIAVMFGLIAWQVFFARSGPAYLLWFAILIWMRDRHPRLIDETDRLSPGRRALAVVLAIVFLLSFMSAPISISLG